MKRKVYFGIGHEGPEEEWSYSSTFSFTSMLDDVEWSTPRPGRFTLRERDLISIV